MQPETPFSISQKRNAGLVFIGGGILAIFVYFALADFTMMSDFMATYFPARALIHHSDPYNPEDVLREYQLQGPNCLNFPLDCTTAIHFPYPPTAFAVTSVFAMMPFKVARALWEVLGAGSLVLGCFLVWKIAADYSPEIAAYLVAVHLANSQMLILSGNPACLAIALCTIAVCCLIRQKHSTIAIVALAISLVLKPQIAGVVWLCLALAGSSYRKRAIQVLFLTLLLAFISIAWVTIVAPSWTGEISQNLAYYMRSGGLDDPGPTSDSRAGWIINLQSVVGLILNVPQFYNLVTYLICGFIIATFGAIALRSRLRIPSVIWPTLAGISAVTLLIVYHRRYDSRLLTLTIPACAMFWSERRKVGRWALAITCATLVFTGDQLWIFTTSLLDKLLPVHPSLFRVLELILIRLPGPLSLLTMAIFYLWVLLYSSPRAAVAESH